MIVVLTGPSGFLGRRVIARLQAAKHNVRALGRRDPGIPGVEFARWDACSTEFPTAALQNAEAVVHLAGEPVAQRWNNEVKRRIRDSRAIGTRNLVQGMARLQQHPRVLISASAIGYYGDRGEEALTENSGPGKGFLSEVCVEWERQAQAASAHGARVAMLRIGIALGPEGGALAQMLPLFRKGVGGPVGSGKQWVSWIHADDIAGLILYALEQEEIAGPINATSPEPVRNVDFAKTLGAALGRPSVVPAPAFGVKLMLGEMADVVLGSQRVLPERATRAGYIFRHPHLGEALKTLLT